MSEQISAFKKDEWLPMTMSEEREWSDVIKTIKSQDKNAILQILKKDARDLGWSEEDVNNIEI